MVKLEFLSYSYNIVIVLCVLTYIIPTAYGVCVLVVYDVHDAL